MSLLSYTELVDLVHDGVITGVKMAAINGTSIDVHLASRLIVEDYTDHRLGHVHIAERRPWKSMEVSIEGSNGYVLHPGEFVLASTVETFNLPSDISAEFRLKSSGARSGLNNLFACHCDPLWHGSALTLALKNQLRYHAIVLTHGVAIGQMLFHRVAPVPQSAGYAVRGRYNNDAAAQGVKA